MKNILFTIEAMAGGGAEKVLLNILRQLDREKFCVTLQLLSHEGVYIQDIPDHVNVRYIFGSKDRYNGTLKWLYKVCRYTLVKILMKFPVLLKCVIRDRTHYDVGVSFCEGFNQAFIGCRKKYFVSTVAWLHIDFRLHNANVSNSFIETQLRRFDKIVCVSNGVKQGVEMVFSSICRTRIMVLYNPIDYDAILQECRDNAIVPKFDVPIITAIGRLSKQKRFDRVLRVAHRFKEEGIIVKFLILGDGPERDRLMQIHRELGLGDYVSFLGFVRKPAPWISRSDIILMTSDYEGLPVVICEAMVLSKPIVATRITGPVELLEDGKYGLLAEPSDDSIYTELKSMFLSEVLKRHFITTLKSNKSNFIFRNDIMEVETLLNSY